MFQCFSYAERESIDGDTLDDTLNDADGFDDTFSGDRPGWRMYSDRKKTASTRCPVCVSI